MKRLESEDGSLTFLLCNAGTIVVDTTRSVVVVGLDGQRFDLPQIEELAQAFAAAVELASP